MIGVSVFVFHFASFLLIIIAVLGIQTMRAGFRNANNPYYTSVPLQARLALGAAWLGLVIYLGVMGLQAESCFRALARYSRVSLAKTLQAQVHPTCYDDAVVTCACGNSC